MLRALDERVAGQGQHREIVGGKVVTEHGQILGLGHDTIPLLLTCALAVTACQPLQGGQPDPRVPVRKAVDRLEVTTIERIDLLLVVDNSGSMRQEQRALQAQLPGMVSALISGDVDADGTLDFPPPQDVRMGVVSTDMGLPTIEDMPGCSGLGDDGLLNLATERCHPDLGDFVSYRAGDDAYAAANDLACLAALGTEGCGFEYSLEAALKALWPASDDRVRFLDGHAELASLGHGAGRNGSFTETDGLAGPSLLVVIVLTDEDDCSSPEPGLFAPSVQLEPGDPLGEQDLNLRCFHNPDRQYPVERYAEGLKLLREGAEHLVLFSAIVGVPPDLVDESAMAEVDLGDEQQRERFYQRLLDDPRMQEAPDPTRTPEQGGNLTPSCVSDGGLAYPPRRIVSVARSFGDNGTVQSICQSDFRPAAKHLLERIAARMGKPPGH